LAGFGWISGDSDLRWRPCGEVKQLKGSYLGVTFRHGRPVAAYLCLPGAPGDKSRRTEQAGVGLIVDYTESGRPIGVEITAPEKVGIADLNLVLTGLHMPALQGEDVAPLRAA